MVINVYEGKLHFMNLLKPYSFFVIILERSENKGHQHDTPVLMFRLLRVNDQVSASLTTISKAHSELFASLA